MNPRLHLDFVAPPPRPALSWLCLLVGAGCLALAADRYAVAEDNLMQAEQQLIRTQRQYRELLADATSTRGDKASRGQGMQREQMLLNDAARPDWKNTLVAVEAALDKDIALLALNQEDGGRRLRLQAEARNIDDALAFADRLRASGKFSEVMLGSHERHQSTGMDVLGFMLTANR